MMSRINRFLGRWIQRTAMKGLQRYCAMPRNGFPSTECLEEISRLTKDYDRVYTVLLDSGFGDVTVFHRSVRELREQLTLAICATSTHPYQSLPGTTVDVAILEWVRFDDGMTMEEFHKELIHDVNVLADQLSRLSETQRGRINAHHYRLCQDILRWLEICNL